MDNDELIEKLKTKLNECVDIFEDLKNDIESVLPFDIIDGVENIRLIASIDDCKNQCNDLLTLFENS